MFPRNRSKNPFNLKGSTKSRNNEESLTQIAFFQWARLSEKKYPQLKKIHSIPNGGKRDAKTGAILKKEGVLAGVWDVFLPFPSRKKCGLYIEFKSQTGRLSKSQKEFRSHLEDYYEFKICRTSQEAIEIVLEYLNLIQDEPIFSQKWEHHKIQESKK